MTEQNQNEAIAREWAARLKRVQIENMKMFGFVWCGKEDGLVTPEASLAYFRAHVDVMRRGGIIEPQFSGEFVDNPTLCTVVAQAIHEGRKALLAVQPDLEDRLNREVPYTLGGRVNSDSSHDGPSR